MHAADIVDESVFAFILAGNLENFNVSRISKSLITIYGNFTVYQYLTIVVRSIVYLIQGFPEPPADKRNAPHFFCRISPPEPANRVVRVLDAQ